MDLKPFILDYISKSHPRLIKSYIWGWIIMINIIGIPTSMYGYLNNYTKILIIPIVTINLWAFYILLNTEKRQKLYELFVGVFCTVMSILLLLASYKVLHPLEGFPLKEFIITTIGLYVVILIFGSIFHYMALHKGFYFYSKSTKSVGIIVLFSTLGVIMGRIIARSVTPDVGAIIVALCALSLAYILQLGIHSIYKYYLINKYEKAKIEL